MQAGDVYTRVALTSEEIETLNPVAGRALLAVYTLEQAASDPEKAAALSQQTGMDLSQLPAGTDPFALLQQLPEEQLAQLSTKVSGQFAALDSRMITQSAAAAVKAEYMALGADAQQLQSSLHPAHRWNDAAAHPGCVVSVIIIGLLSARTAAGIARDVRRDIFSKVESFSKAEFETFSTASLITRSTNDITQIQMVIVDAACAWSSMPPSWLLVRSSARLRKALP